MGWATCSHCCDEFIRCYIGLTQNTGKGASFNFTVHWDNTTFDATSHDDMASGLADFLKSQTR